MVLVDCVRRDRECDLLGECDKRWKGLVVVLHPFDEGSPSSLCTLTIVSLVFFKNPLGGVQGARSQSQRIIQNHHEVI